MPEDDLKPNNGSTSSSSGSSGSGDAASGSGDNSGTEDYNTSAKKPSETPRTDSAASNGSANADAGKNEGLQRNLGDETKVLLAEKEPEKIDPITQAKAAADIARSRYNLTEEQAAHLQNGLTGFAMSGMQISSALVDSQVKNVAPVNFEMTKFKEMVCGTMSHVAEAGLSYLAPPAANLAKQQQASPTLTA